MLLRTLHSSNLSEMRFCDFPVWPQDLGKGPNVPPRAGRGTWGDRLTKALSPAACQCSRIAAHNRTNCGFPGITPDTCFDSGCCFSSKIPNVPWCFHPLPKQGNRPGSGPLPAPTPASQQGRDGGPWPAVHTWSPKGQPLAPPTDTCENPPVVR